MSNMRDIPKGDDNDYLRDPESHITRFQAFADSIGMRHQLMGQEGIPIRENSPFHGRTILSRGGNNPYVEIGFDVKADVDTPHVPMTSDIYRAYHPTIYKRDNPYHDKFIDELRSRGPTEVRTTFNHHPIIGFTSRGLNNIRINNPFNTLAVSQIRTNPIGYEHLYESLHEPSMDQSIEPFGLSDIHEKLKKAQGVQKQYFTHRRKGTPEGYDEFFDKVQNADENIDMFTKEHYFGPQFLYVSHMNHIGSVINDAIDLNTGTWAKNRT